MPAYLYQRMKSHTEIRPLGSFAVNVMSALEGVYVQVVNNESIKKNVQVVIGNIIKTDHICPSHSLGSKDV